MSAAASGSRGSTREISNAELAGTCDGRSAGSERTCEISPPGGALQLKVDSTHDRSSFEQLGARIRLGELPELRRCRERTFLRELRLAAGRRALRRLRDDPHAGREVLPSLRHRRRRARRAPSGCDLDHAAVGDRRHCARGLIALLAGQRFRSAPPADRAGAGPAQGAPQGEPMPGPAARCRGRRERAHRTSRTCPRASAPTVSSIASCASTPRGRRTACSSSRRWRSSAYQMIPNPDADARFDMGRIAEVAGAFPAAKSEADSILAKQPTHLLGLVLAMQVARSSGDAAGATRTAPSCAPRRNPSSPRSFRSTTDTSPTSETRSRASSAPRTPRLARRSLYSASHADQDDSRRAQPRLRRRVHVLRARRGEDRYRRPSLRARAAGHRVAQPARAQGGARGHRGLDPRVRVSHRALRAAAARLIDGRSLRAAARRARRR